MTDKIKFYFEDRLKRLESIRNEREWTTAELGDIACCKQTLELLDSMQEEPTSVWHDTRSEEPIVGRNIVMWYYDHIYSGEYLGERFFGREKWTLMSDSKWAYFEDLIKL